MPENRIDFFFRVWFPVLVMVCLGALALAYLLDWWVALVVIFATGALWIIASIQSISPVHAALVLRLDRRVVIDETEFYRTDADGTRHLIPVSEFKPDEPGMSRVRKYLTKGEGWRIFFPILERPVIFSLAIQQKIVESSDVYTEDRVHIKPVIFATWRIVNLNQAVEIEGATRGRQGEERVNETVVEAIKVAMRGVFSTCSVKEALARERGTDAEHPDQKPGPLGKLLKEEIQRVVAEWGVVLSDLLVQDVEPAEGSKDVFDALKAVTSEGLIREKDLVAVDKEYQVRVKKAEAGLIEKRKEAEGVIVLGEADARKQALQIGAFVGKTAENFSVEDANAWAHYMVSQQAAKSLDNNSTVILPPGDLGRFIGRFGGLIKGFQSAKTPDVKTPDKTG